MGDFRKVEVWKKSMVLVTEIYRITKDFPNFEKFGGLVSQMTRAATSIPSNISEGCKREYDKEYYYFLRIARGSIGELQTQLYISVNVGYLTEDDIEHAISLSIEIDRMLYSLIRRLSVNHQNRVMSDVEDYDYHLNNSDGF